MTSNDTEEEVLKHFGGMTLNNLRNVILDLDDIETTIESVSHSPYLDCSILGGYLKQFTNDFSVLSLNIQCLSAKYNHLCAFLKDIDDHNFRFSVICLQETWLRETDNTALFDIPGYQSLHLNASCSSHGGLVVYVADNYQCKTQPLYEVSNIWEGQFVDIYDSENKYTVCNIYRPPRDRNDIIDSFLTTLSSRLDRLCTSTSHLIIVGDFNIDLLSVNLRQKFSEYLDMMLSQGLTMQLCLPTRFSTHRATLIDHIFTKLPPSHPTSQSGIILSHISDHLPTFICIKKKSHRLLQPKYIHVQVRSEKAQEAFCNEINSINFLDIIDLDPNCDPTTNFKTISEKIETTRIKHMPYKKVRFKKYKHKIAPWITNGILQSIKYKDILYKKLKLTSTTDPLYHRQKTNFQTYSNILRKSINNAKNMHYHSQLTLHKKDSRKTWEVIKSLLNTKSTKRDFPSFFLIDNHQVSNEQKIADNFNKFFSNIGTLLASKIQTSLLPNFATYLRNPTGHTFNFNELSTTEFIKIVNDFKPKTSVGVDNLSMKLFKKISPCLAQSLTVIINQSLNTGIFPKDLKISKISPIFKKGCDKLFDNYRPISLLPCFSKIVERVVYNQLYQYFETHKLFYFSQHGFRKRHSTETATLEFIDKIFHHLDNNKLPLAIFIDLSKAFDTIDHDILLSKLQYYGIQNTSLRWFSSYLSNRMQYVSFNDTSSALVSNDVGVPQGSILGPLLFIIYMNDLCCVSERFNPILYADDTTLENPLCSFNMLESASNSDISRQINLELTKISNWLSVNKLSINSLKSKFMLFHLPQRHKNSIPQLNLSLNGIPIEQVSEFNFLGIVIDETLSWKPHLNKICTRISRSVGVIKRLSKTLPTHTLITLYNSLILPHIRYGILAWRSNITRIRKLQKKAVRAICKTKYNAHTAPLFKSLSLLTVDDLVKLESLKFAYKYNQKTLPVHLLNIFDNGTQVINHHRYETRNRYLIPPARPNKKSCENCVRYTIPYTLKHLPNLITDKIQTHSCKGMTMYFKTFILNSYESECHTVNCYICQT